MNYKLKGDNYLWTIETQCHNKLTNKPIGSSIKLRCRTQRQTI